MNLDPSVATLLLAANSGSGGAKAEVQLPGTASRLPDALIDRLAAAVRTLVVSGTVTQSQAVGTVMLRTQFGPLQFQSSSPIPVGGQAVLTIPPPGPGMSAAALSARSIPATLLLPGTPTAAATTPAAPGAAPIAGSALPSAPVLPGGQLVAGLGGIAQSGTTASAPAVSAAGPATAAQPGSPLLSASASSASAPSALPGGTPTTSGQASAAGAQTAPPAAGAQQPSNAHSGQSPSQATQLYGRTAASAGPISSPGPTTAPTPVAAHGPFGAPAAGPTGQAALPDAGTGSLAGRPAKPPHSLPHRPTSAQPQAAAGGNTTAAAAASGAAALPSGEGVTPALREALAALGQLDPALAGQAAQRSVPQPGPQMGAALLLFVAAARGGDVRGWLGDKPMRVLEAKGKGDIANRLTSDFTALTRQLTEAPASDWRSIPVPVFDRGSWSDLQLHIGPPPQDDGTDPARPRGKRFVIDVTLSQLGPLQLDGTLTARHLDLAVRTHDPFSLAERREMSATFAKVCEGTGLTGSLSFQPDGHNWLRLTGSSRGQHAR